MKLEYSLIFMFYVKSSGTFDGFLFITLLKVNKKFFLSIHTIHKYTKKKIIIEIIILN